MIVGIFTLNDLLDALRYNVPYGKRNEIRIQIEHQKNPSKRYDEDKLKDAYDEFKITSPMLTPFWDARIISLEILDKNLIRISIDWDNFKDQSGIIVARWKRYQDLHGEYADEIEKLLVMQKLKDIGWDDDKDAQEVDAIYSASE